MIPFPDCRTSCSALEARSRISWARCRNSRLSRCCRTYQNNRLGRIISIRVQNGALFLYTVYRYHFPESGLITDMRGLDLFGLARL